MSIAFEASAGAIAEHFGVMSSPSVDAASIKQPTRSDMPAARHAVPLDDEEWNKLPRNRVRLHSFVRRDPDKLEARMLFRNASLNPRDAYIPSADRLELSLAIDSLRPYLAGYRRATAFVYDTEFRRQVDLGNARQLNMELPTLAVTHKDGTTENAHKLDLTQLKARGADIATIRNGRVLGLGKAELPGCAAVLEKERFLDVEFGSGLVGWFHVRGLLDHAEAGALNASLFRN